MHSILPHSLGQQKIVKAAEEAAAKIAKAIQTPPRRGKVVAFEPEKASA